MELPVQPLIQAKGANAVAIADDDGIRRWRVIPTPGATVVELIATDGSLSTRATFTVGPPSSKVELSLDPPDPVKGRNTSARLRVTVTRPDGRVDVQASPPVLRSNVGRIVDLIQEEPGKYAASYLLPETRFPEVVVIAAFAPWPYPDSIQGAVGRILVPLSSAIDLPGTTEPMAQMSIEIAGKVYGPIQADPAGHFKLPVVVPPGHRYGKGTATDRFGNKRTTQVDLMLPPTQQLVCVANPLRLPLDGQSRARILCAASDAFGKPLSASAASLSAKRGQVGRPAELENGMTEWIYQSPKGGEPGRDPLVATVHRSGLSGRQELEVQLVQGPAATVEFAPFEPVVHLAGEARFELGVKDLWDRPRPGAQLLLSAAVGRLNDPIETAPGRFSIQWVGPRSSREPDEILKARAFGPVGTDPARIVAWLEEGHVWAAVTDLSGSPVPNQRLVLGEEVRTTGPVGTVDLGPAKPGKWVVRHAQWPGLARTLHLLDGGRRLFPSGKAPLSKEVIARLKLAPPIPINVRLAIQGSRITYWAEAPDGGILADRPLEVEVSTGTRGAPTVQAGRTSFELRTPSPSSVSVSDPLTGVTAVGEVRP